MSSLSNCCKRYLHNHSHLVDFLSASLIICLCLIVLLPKVHESFRSSPLAVVHEEAGIAANPPDGLVAMTTAAVAATMGPTSTLSNSLQLTEPDEGHQHNHRVPMGEVLICAGFFVFYCVGLGISRLNAKERAPLLMAERKVSTVCCSSTRCPSSQQEIISAGAEMATTVARLGMSKSQDTVLESEQLVFDQGKYQQDDCVLLLNQHHNHHTHSRHHEHPNGVSNLNKRTRVNDYGSTSRNGVEPDLVIPARNNDSKPSAVYVEEISITRRIRGVNEDEIYLSWPLSIKVTVFGLLLAGFLVIFDLNIHGLMQSIKVFRAAATGALLYLAFFLVLPKNTAGCNSCIEEEV